MTIRIGSLKRKPVFSKEYKTSPERRASWRMYYKKNAARMINKSSQWHIANREIFNARERVRRKRLREELIAAYGSVCSCCGLTEPRFLTLEHKNRDGMVHRKSVGGNYPIYVDLKRLGYPKENFTLLCWNCNCSTRYGEPCPHVIQKKELCEFPR